MKIPADEPPAGTNRAAQPPKPRAKAPRECRKGVQEVVKASEVQGSHVQGKRALVDGRPQADARTAPKKSQWRPWRERCSCNTTLDPQEASSNQHRKTCVDIYY